MTAQPQALLSPQDYLARERDAEGKSEYYRGEVFAMSGASRRHNLIAGNMYAALHVQLRQRPCEVYVSDMRVKVSPTVLYTYPDVVVVCGEPAFEDEHVDTLLNPTVLIEVLSPSTADYDRGGKFAQYRTLESLAEYVLVAQDEPHVEHFARESGSRWILVETSDPEAMIELATMGCTLALRDLYEKVDFGAD